MSTSARAYLVESIPKGLEDLRGTPGVAYTGDVLVQLTSRAKSTIYHMRKDARRCIGDRDN